MENNKTETNKTNKKKYLGTIFLFLILALIIIFNSTLPSKNEIKEIAIKEKNINQKNLIKMNAYNFNYQKNSLEKYEIELKEDTMENILKYVLNDILNKNLRDKEIEIEKIYFGNGSAYLELNKKNINIDENTKEALLKTTQEMFSVSTLNFI